LETAGGCIDGLFSELRPIAETIPDGLIPYSIRHRDDDDSVPVTIEACVVVNYFGTLIVNAPLDFGGSDHIAIIGWSFNDEPMAVPNERRIPIQV
jgi:hypothetical protein